MVEAAIADFRPEVVALGPVNKLTNGNDQTSNSTASALLAFFDDLSDRYGDLVDARRSQDEVRRHDKAIAGSPDFIRWVSHGVHLGGQNGKRQDLTVWRESRFGVELPDAVRRSGDPARPFEMVA